MVECWTAFIALARSNTFNFPQASPLFSAQATPLLLCKIGHVRTRLAAYVLSNRSRWQCRRVWPAGVARSKPKTKPRESTENMSASLTRFLKDFSAPPPAAMVEDTFFDFPAPEDVQFEMPAAPEVDLEEVRKLAFEEGRAAMRAELEVQHAGAVAALRKAQADALSDAKERFEAESVEKLAGQLKDIEGRVEELLSAGLLEVLIPIINDEMAKRAIESLAEIVRTVFQDEEGLELVLRGPQTLADPLADLIASSDYRLRHIESDDIDLTVEHGDVVLMTRLSAWAESVGELLK